MSSFALWSVPVATGLAYAPHFTRVAILMRHDVFDTKEPRDIVDTGEDMTDALVKRLGNAHKNQLETLGLYAGGIAAATAAGVCPKRTTQVAVVYIGARMVYNVAYASPQVGQGAMRSTSFTVALGAALYLWVSAAQKVTPT